MLFFFMSASKNNGAGTRYEPFNFTSMAANSISFGAPRLRFMGRTCGEPNGTKKIPTRKILPSCSRAGNGYNGQQQVRHSPPTSTRRGWDSGLARPHSPLYYAQGLGSDRATFTFVLRTRAGLARPHFTFVLRTTYRIREL